MEIEIKVDALFGIRYWHLSTGLTLQPTQISFYGNAVYPNGASSWSWLLQIALLFPKLTKTQEMLLEQKLKQLEESPAKQ